jgi:3-hydroxybutyryl-CoA dehydrogenase
LATKTTQFPGWTGLEVDGARLMVTDGSTAGAIAASLRRADVAVFDRLFNMPPADGMPVAFAAAEPIWQDRAGAWLAALGFVPLPMADAPGLVVARTVAMRR